MWYILNNKGAKVSPKERRPSGPAIVGLMQTLHKHIYRVSQKTGPYFQLHNFLYNDLGRQSMCQNVQLFIRIMNDILNAAVFKYSFDNVRQTILH